MKSKVRNKLQARVLAAAVCSLAISAAAQKPGGTLRVVLRENPGSMSLAEESSVYTKIGRAHV